MRVLGIAAVCAAAVAWSGQADAASSVVDTIHIFNQTDGNSPQSTLIQDAAGALYGTADYGGTHNTACPQVTYTVGSSSLNYTVPQGCGLVFKLAPPAKGQKSWTETVLHDFNGGSDGILPAAGLVVDKSGNLYGITVAGGAGASFCAGKGGRADIGAGLSIGWRVPPLERRPGPRRYCFASPAQTARTLARR
jgi:hypothetical protein